MRNIPAYAGKTDAASYLCLAHEEHPRVCGENVLAAPLEGEDTGTSPRMRGKLQSWVVAGLLGRNIPAYAGKT